MSAVSKLFYKISDKILANGLQIAFKLFASFVSKQSSLVWTGLYRLTSWSRLIYMCKNISSEGYLLLLIYVQVLYVSRFP